MAAVRIIAVPPGEAPEDIRRAWVGLILPLVLPGRQVSKTGGVLTSPQDFWVGLFWRLTGRYTSTVGYVVESATAIAVLNRDSPEAARWWAENVPSSLAPGRLFVFAESACEEVEETIWPPPPKPGDY